MPKLWIKNFVQRARRKGVWRRETNLVTTKILRHIIRVTDFGQSASRKRLINFFAWVGWQIGELPIGHAISHGADFSVDWISPEIHEPDAIVLQLRRGNQRIVWRDGLSRVGHVEISAKHDLIVVTIERGMKCWIAIIGRTKDHVEHHHSRARREQPIKQKRPYFA